MDRLREENQRLQQGHWMPPGHFYSPIPDIADIKAREAEIFENIPRQLPGIDHREAEQLSLFKQFAAYFQEADFPAHKEARCRYYHQNQWYPYGDAMWLHCMIRHRRPKRIIEVGSGFSSCVILDANERFFNNSIACTFIEPNPSRLLEVVHPEDRAQMDLIQKPLQSVPTACFEQLQKDDILFIDSTHVSKIGSDVNYLFFDVLPSLGSGVAVHIHDVWYPFEYPKPWVLEGRAWNEAYLLRAFLQYNSAFRILFFPSLLYQFHADLIRQEAPLAASHGGSIWIEKI